MKTMKTFALTLAVLMLPSGLLAQQEKTTTITTTETAGTISEVKPDTLVVRTETSTAPMNYVYTKSTTYVDNNGTPVSMETVKSGLPVTVYYTREGDRLIANKVVVRQTTTTGTPATEEKRTDTTTTRTTTEKK